MTKLLDRLLQHLSAVIIRYHDNQITDPSKKIMTDLNVNPLTYSSNTLNSTEPPYESLLTEYIRECTERHPDRRTLLEYCLNQIVFLKNTQTQLQPYSAEEFEQYKNQMFRIFQDFKTLLNTSKHEACRVQHHYTDDRVSSEVTIVGLINPGFTYNSLCYSGTLITEMLAAFQLTPTSSEQQIAEFTDDLCTTHQTYLQATDSARQLVQALAHNERLQMELDAERTKARRVEALLIEANSALEEQQQKKRLHIRSAVNLSGLFGTLNLPSFKPPPLDENAPAAPIDFTLALQ